MNIYEFAMKMERDGENYYRELAALTVSAGLGNIFTMLADSEADHYDIFKKMEGDQKVRAVHSRILSHVKNIFTKMREEEKAGDLNITQTELYKKAREIEKDSMDFYLKHAEEIKDADQRENVLKIAGEEKKHLLILEEIVSFVSRPDGWLENAEWYHLEEY